MRNRLRHGWLDEVMAEIEQEEHEEPEPSNFISTRTPGLLQRAYTGLMHRNRL